MVLIHSVEEVKRYAYSQSGRSLDSLILTIYALLSTAFKFVAEVTRHTDALLEYRVHNLFLTSDSRQDLQLDPHSIPSLRLEQRYSYQFCLPANYTIL